MSRLWGGISARLEQRKPARRWVWVTAGAMAVAAAGAFAFVASERGPSPWEGAAFETEHAPLTVALADGSSMRLDSSSRVEVSGSGSAQTSRTERSAGADAAAQGSVKR